MAGKGVKSDRWFLLAPSFLILWVMGLGFLWWVVVPSSILIKNLVSKTAVRFNSASMFLVALGVWLLGSLAVGIMSGNVEVRSAAGAAFSAFVWISAGALHAIISQLSRRSTISLVRGLILLVSIQGALTGVAVLTFPSPLASFELPAHRLLNTVDSLGPWLSANLAYTAYFGELVHRSAGLMGAAAWSGGFAALMIIILVLKRRALIISGLHPILWVIATGLAILSLQFSYSRVSSLLCLGVIIYFILVRAANGLLPKVGAILVNLLAMLILVFGITFAPWQDYLSEQDALRPGSSQTRISSYSNAWDALSAGNFFSFLVGLGDKPTVVEGSFGAGSESTFFSLLVRGGVVALGLFVLFILSRMRQSLREKDLATVLLLIALSIHAVVADLDVGTLTLMTAFLALRRIDVSSEEKMLSHPGSRTERLH